MVPRIRSHRILSSPIPRRRQYFGLGKAICHHVISPLQKGNSGMMRNLCSGRSGRYAVPQAEILPALSNGFRLGTHQHDIRQPSDTFGLGEML